MKNRRSLIGGVIMWGLLGAGVYTVVNIAMPYFTKAPAVPESLKTGVSKIKNKVTELSAKTADKIKKSVIPETRQQKSLPPQKQSERPIVQSDQKTEEHNSPVKRLSRIADNYMNEEGASEDIPKEESVQADEQENAPRKNRETTAAPPSKTDTAEEELTIHQKEQKVFSRQLSVIDDLLN